MRKLLTGLYAFVMTCWSMGVHGQDNFSCATDLYQVVNGKDLKLLDPATGVYTTIGSSSINYNGAGFNYEDGYIYGVGSGNVLVRIDNTGEATNLGSISNFTALSYSGDLDTLGVWYGFRKVSGSWIMNAIDVSAASPTAVESPVTELSGVASASNCADISFNAVTGKFYGMSSGILTAFDPTNQTVQTIADYSASTESGSYGAVWSDNEGNTYFFNNNTGNIYRAVFDGSGNITSFGFSATSAPNGSNDGMSCPLAAPPVFPEICDNGLDDDGDGLVDCDDPDCTSTETCGISAEIVASDESCAGSIITYHTFYTNNAPTTNTITLTETLPSGFIFLEDSISFDDGGSSDFTLQPTEGATGTLQWGTITLNGGETVKISYDVSIDGSATNGTHANGITASLGNAGTAMFPTSLSADVVISTCPTPATFQCEPAFYQVYKKKGKKQPNVYGRLDPVTGDYDQIAIASDFANGLGYDINTGLVFGACGKKFIQLDENGIVKDMGITFNKKVYRGDINESSLWYGVDGGDMVVIDVSSTPTVVATYSGQGLSGWDIAYNKDGNFYSVHNSTLYKFDTTTNTKSTVASLFGFGIPSSGGYGAQWTGSDGYLYASHNSTGTILRVDVTTGESRQVSSSIDGLSLNDGFSCPLDIPAVYEFDYSDNSALTQARVLSYYQDATNDGLPDFAAVWLGNTVSYNTSDPANVDADGDTDEDGVTIDPVLDQDSLSVYVGLNTNEELYAYYGFGIDWNDDGSFEEIVLDSLTMTGASTVSLRLAAPSGFTNGDINVRAIVAEESLSGSDLVGDFVAMGEVEDYRMNVRTPEDCTNGIDDDGDGLVDCDDPDCFIEEECGGSGPTGSGGEGGLESNDRLASKIAKTQFFRNKAGKVDYDDKSQLRLINRGARYGAKNTSRRTLRNESIEQYIPIDVIEGTETHVSSPEHLTDLTNALEVFSVDVFEEDLRLGVVLALTSENGVYEHTKYVCDRLGGSSVEDILTYKIDGEHGFHIAKMKLANGNYEYATSFSVRLQEEEFVLESHWNLAHYTDDETYYNFQVWANSTDALFRLTNEILRLLEVQRSIAIYEFGELPGVFINEATMEGGQLNLTLTNRTGSTQLSAEGQYSESEIGETFPLQETISLSGNLSEEVGVEIGSVYDLGLTFHNDENDMPDVIFMADGAWGTDYDNSVDQVSYFDITASEFDDVSGFPLNRNVSISGEVLQSVAVFRSLKPSWRDTDLSAYNALSFELSGQGTVEVTLVKSSVQDWADQPRATVQLNEEMTVYALSANDFNSARTAAWDDLTMVVFDVKGDGEQFRSFEMNVQNVQFVEGIVASVDIDQVKEKLMVFPNPVHEEMGLNFSTQVAGKYTVKLFDITGTLVKKYEGVASQGENKISISDLPRMNGNYIYILETPDADTHEGKVIINR